MASACGRCAATRGCRETTMTRRDDPLGFSPADDQPVRYIDRTHAWYDAIGTNNRYRYATYRDVPFAPDRKSVV